VHAVHASDLDRAYATGKAVADLLSLPITTHAALREIYAGEWEGMRFDVLPIRFPHDFQIWLEDIGHAVCTGGESVSDLQKRVLTVCQSIADQNPGKTVAIATHATVIRSLQCFCMGMSLDQMKDIPWVSNGSISVMEIDEGRCSMPLVGYDAHLGNNRSQLPSNV